MTVSYTSFIVVIVIIVASLVGAAIGLSFLYIKHKKLSVAYHRLKSSSIPLEEEDTQQDFT